MSGGMWKAVETSTREIGIGKAKGRRRKGGSTEEERGEEEEEEIEKGKNSGGQKNSRGMGSME